MKKRLVLLIGAPRTNKGSEAIVRGVVEICGRLPVPPEIVLCAMESETECCLSLPQIVLHLPQHGLGKGDRFLQRWISRLRYRLRWPCEGASRFVYRRLLAEVDRADLVVVVGGDNYDASYGNRQPIYALNRLLRNTANGPMLLYDCSLAEPDFDDAVKADFLSFDAITVRESMTEAACRRRLGNARVHCFPDPAFVMPPETTLLPSGWQSGMMVGINASRLVAQPQYGADPAAVMNAYEALIEHILRSTNLGVVLVPHVMNNADLSMLRPLFNRFESSKRVLLIDNESLSAPQLKHIISQCRLYVGARTHSTIAAYSSLVPTLVVGYSVKSVGIARDLFGSEDGMVVPVRDLQGGGAQLVAAFRSLHAHEAAIREHLAHTIPPYREKVYATATLLQDLLSGDTDSNGPRVASASGSIMTPGRTG